MMGRKSATTFAVDLHATSGECSVKAMAAKVLSKTLAQFLSHTTH